MSRELRVQHDLMAFYTKCALRSATTGAAMMDAAPLHEHESEPNMSAGSSSVYSVGLAK